MSRNNLTNDKVDWLIAQQIKKLLMRPRMNLEESKVLVNIQKIWQYYFCNTTFTIRVISDQNLKGDNLIFAAFGGGFTWGSI
jgi:3-oxoacyl-[acyl-carrier-protein] synthase-3